MKSAQATDDTVNESDHREECVTRYVPTVLQMQSPVIVGLIAHLCGDALQDTIAETTRRLFEKGQAVMGL
jgi:hypothetical protein